MEFAILLHILFKKKSIKRLNFSTGLELASAADRWARCHGGGTRRRTTAGADLVLEVLRVCVWVQKSAGVETVAVRVLGDGREDAR